MLQPCLLSGAPPSGHKVDSILADEQGALVPAACSQVTHSQEVSLWGIRRATGQSEAPHQGADAGDLSLELKEAATYRNEKSRMPGRQRHEDQEFKYSPT